jgi:hypothetical protein
VHFAGKCVCVRPYTWLECVSLIASTLLERMLLWCAAPIWLLQYHQCKPPPYST